jgi:ACS family hexuronate transporter-like MFS transporter
MRFAWWVMGLLFLGSVVNYMDRTAMSVVVPQIRKDLSLTNTDYGFAVNAFLLTYMVFYTVGGRLADRFGCRIMVILTIIWWSVAKILHAFAYGLGSLSVYRALLGIGEGGFYPAAMRGVAEWFSPADRAKGVGIFLCGLGVGALITPPLVAWITLHYGWRAAFVFTGAIGFLLLPPWLILHRRIRAAYGTADPAPAYREDELQQTDPTEDVPLGRAVRHRKFLCILAARACTDVYWFFYLFWMPAYFQDERGLSLATVGMLLWIPYLATDIGSLSGAWISSALIRRGWSIDRSRKLVLLVSASMGVTAALAYFAPSTALAIGMISFAFLGHMSWGANIHTAITEIAPRKHIAAMYGITGSIGTMMGAVSQPIIGRLVDRLGYGPNFVGAGLLYVLAVAFLVFGVGKIERIKLRG